MSDPTNIETTLPSVHELLAGKTREEIIDAWMEDKLFFQAQVRRLQGVVRELYAIHGKTHAVFQRSAMDVVLTEQKPDLVRWRGAFATENQHDVQE